MHHPHHHHDDAAGNGVGRSRDMRPRRHGPHRMGPPMGPEAFMRFGRGRRSRRGDVRAAVLVLLEEQSRNGYQLMQEIETRSGGAWRPSPGSMYPVLNQLEDEGLITSGDETASKTFSLTAAGKTEVAERREVFGKPWESAAASISEGRQELVRALRQLAGASRQVIEAGSDAQSNAAAEILRDARKKIYQLLADDTEE